MNVVELVLTVSFAVVQASVVRRRRHGDVGLRTRLARPLCVTPVCVCVTPVCV